MANTEQERIVGFEMECPITIYGTSDSGQPEVLAGPNITPVLRKMCATTNNGHTELGFRFYKDGTIDEICTPQTTPQHVGLLQLVSERFALQAAEQIVVSMQQVSCRKLEPPQQLHASVMMRVFGGKQSAGFHENYQILAYDPTGMSRLALNHYAATCGVWQGQGLYDPVPNWLTATQKFGMDQRTMRGSKDGMVVKPYNALPPHRYEFRKNDYPTTFFQLRHRAPYTSAVLRAVETSKLRIPLFLADPDEVRVLVAHDRNRPLQVTDGSFMSPLEHQLRIAEKVVAAAIDYPDYEQTAATEVLNILQELHEGRIERVQLAAGYLFKRHIIAKKFPEFLENGNRVSPQATSWIQGLDIAVDTLGYGGLLQTLLRKKAGSYGYSEHEVLTAALHPPMIAVAQKRAQAIQVLGKKAKRFNASWETATLEVSQKQSKSN